MIVYKPILPLAGITLSGVDRRIQRSVAREAAVHRDDLFLGDVQLGGDLRHMLGLQITVIDGLDAALRTAQVEEQTLLVGGRAHLHQRP